jgi:hypothetical protein
MITRCGRAKAPLRGRIEVARRGHNARMDDSAYPLALADRAFAYDGSFRTPDAMSAANRAAYGLHRNCAGESTRVFRAALHRATAHVGFGSYFITRGNVSGPIARPPCPLRLVHSGVAQREDDLAVRSARPPVRTREPVWRTSSPYALFVSVAGCTIRAIAWRGRVFCGGVPTCPKSIP